MNDGNLNQQNQNDNLVSSGGNTQPQMNGGNQPVNPAPQMNAGNQPVNPGPQINPNPILPNKPNKKNKGIIFAIIGIIVVILAIVLAFSLNNNNQDDNDKSEPKESEKSGIKNSSLMANTKWIASDGSEVVFTSNKISWYQEEGIHSDNYYEGKYKFYIGKDAVEYITKELKEYGITKSELEIVFSSDKEYSESNFVVFDIRYDKFILDGEKMEISRPLVPWYGFILEDNTFLDVANMNTASYYKFTKK